MPAGTASVPAVVLVQGSGPSDRDETFGGSKPFKDVALGLATRGIAVLRYDKRTKVHGARMAAGANFTVQQEVIDDVLEAVKGLRAQTRIDPARIFVLGHSLGGMLIPRIGTVDQALAGLVVMAGAARPIEEAIVAQTRYLALGDGAVSADEQHRRVGREVEACGAVEALSRPVQCAAHGVGERAACSVVGEGVEGVGEPVDLGLRRPR